MDIGGGDPSLFLIHYFIELAENQTEEIDFTHMERLVECGANINDMSGRRPQALGIDAEWVL